MASAVHHQRVPPQGFAHGAVATLTSSDPEDARAWQWPAHRGRLLSHAVLARDDVLRVWEVRALHGGVKLHQVRMHRLFGEVTGIRRVRTIASQYDGRDRLLLSFRDAKLALMEWSDAYGDIHTISIHTFERAPQLATGLPRTFVPALRTDPGNQCAALLLPQDAVAILPLYQDLGEMDLGEEAKSAVQILSELPYAPSFVLSLANDVDAGIKNVRDILFLPGFQKPTLAVLYESQLTWTGSLSLAKQTMRVCLVTLDLTISHYPVTVTSEALPYDCLYLVACPESLGGVMIVTPSAILHMDQTARLVGLATNGWYEKTSDLPLPKLDGPELDLQSSQLVFTDANSGLLFLVHGAAYTLQCAVEGRSITSLSLRSVQVPPDAPPCAFAERIGSHVLCASIQGDTRLYAVETHMAESAPAAAAADTTLDEEEMDLYGETSAPSAPTAMVQTQRLYTLDTLSALCALNDICVGDVRDTSGHLSQHSVVALSHGLGTIETRVRNSVGDSIAPALQVWSAALADATLLLAAWDEECLVYAYDTPPRFVAQCAGRTLACAAAPDRQYALRVTPSAVERIDAQGTSTPIFQRDDAQITHACILDAYAAWQWSDGGVEVYQFVDGAYTRVPLSLASCAHLDLYVDAAGAFGPPSTWLMLATHDGRIELRTLPDGALHWQSRSLRVLPSRLHAADGEQREEQESMTISALRLCTLGDVPTLVVQYEHGLLAVLEARPPPPASIVPFLAATEPRALGFVRLDAMMLSAPCTSIDPFVGFGGHACVALPGAHALFLVRDAHSPVQWIESDIPFADFCTLPGEDWTTVGVQNEQASVLHWAPVALDGLCPYTRWTTGREYTHVACHEETGCVVAASVQPVSFVLYNDIGEPVQDPGLDPMPTQSERGALELFPQLGVAPVHGYELEPNEVVTALHVAPLDARDRMSARRSFVTVGTLTTYGEDRVTKGHMYVFDVIEAVPYAPGEHDSMQLKLIFREEMRAPVTALSSLNGYLVAAVGQKLLIRAFEFTEWLVTIAFLETAFYTTHIQRVKNFLLLTDYHRSAYFVAFQEEPAQLHLLGRDFYTECLTHGALLIHREKLALVTADLQGCVRLLDYNPANPTSLGGQRLLVRTEYYLSNEVAQTLVLRGPRDAASGECFSSEVLLAKRNGAIDLLVPVDDKVFQILQLFQSQLVRSVRHTAGLNPRAFRAVMNLHVSRPLVKGILDGTLLHAAENMSRPKLVRLVQDLRVRTGGVEPDDVLRCLVHLQPQW